MLRTLNLRGFRGSSLLSQMSFATKQVTRKTKKVEKTATDVSKIVASTVEKSKTPVIKAPKEAPPVSTNLLNDVYFESLTKGDIKAARDVPKAFAITRMNKVNIDNATKTGLASKYKIPAESLTVLSLKDGEEMITVVGADQEHAEALLYIRRMQNLGMPLLLGEGRVLVSNALKLQRAGDYPAALQATIQVIRNVPPQHWSEVVPEMFVIAAANPSGEPLALLVNELFEAEAQDIKKLHQEVKDGLLDDSELAEAERTRVRRLPAFAWADLVKRSAFMIDKAQGEKAFAVLRHLPSSPTECYSDAASNYLRERTQLMGLDIQASVQNIRKQVKEGELHPIQAKADAAAPFVTLTFNADKVGAFESFQTRSDSFNPDSFVSNGDVLLLKPPRAAVPTGVDDWALAYAAEVTQAPKKSEDGKSYSVKLKLINGEAFTVPNILLQPQLDVFYLQSFLTQNRALKAIEDFTIVRRVHPLQRPVSFFYSDPIRFILTEPDHPLVFSANYYPYVPPTAATDSSTDQQPKSKSLSDRMLKAFEKGGRSVEDEGAMSLLAANLMADQSKGKAEFANEYTATLNTLCGLHYKDPNFTIQQEAEAGMALYAAAPVPKTTLPLTEAQLSAVRAANAQRVSIIQGPPGTGKTHTIAAVVESWVNADPNALILVTAESNSATDNLVRTFARLGIRALRSGTGGDPLIAMSTLKETFPEEVAALDPYAPDFSRNLRGLMKKAMGKYQVVITTCMSSCNDLLSELSFDKLVIDECTQAIEPNTLVPVGKMCSRLVLIGDHKQLPPTVALSTDTPEGQQLSVSLFERLVKSPLEHVMKILDVQHRMHPSIAHFSSFQFYDALVKNFKGIAPQRPPIGGFTFPNPEFRVAIMDTQGKYPEETVGTSCRNLGEARTIVSLVRDLGKDRSANAITPNQIAILTPYDAQRQLIKQMLIEAFGQDVTAQMMVDSVDGAQGSEKEIVIFSATRSNPKGNIGFLRDPRRMNVMLTRARRGLVIVADYECLRKSNSVWKPWTNYVRKQLSVVKL